MQTQQTAANSNPNAVSTTLVPEINHVARFEQTFKLEGELVGSTRMKKSTKGVVRLELLPLKSSDGMPSLGSVSGLSGDDLAFWKRQQSDKLKTEMCALTSRLGSDTGVTGRSVVMNAKGNRITLTFEKAAPMSVTKATPESLAKSAEALGYKLVPIEKPAELNPAANGAATIAQPANPAQPQPAKK